MGQHEHDQASKRDKARRALSKSSKPAWNSYTFVRIELTEEEKRDFRAMLAAGEFDTLSAGDLLEYCDKLSLSRGDNDKTFIVSLTRAQSFPGDTARILTARASDPGTAMAVAAYKLFYLVGERTWSQAESERGGSYSDIG